MGQGAGTQTHVGAQPRTYTHTRHNAQPQGTVTLSHVGTGNVRTVGTTHARIRGPDFLQRIRPQDIHPHIPEWQGRTDRLLR